MAGPVPGRPKIQGPENGAKKYTEVHRNLKLKIYMCTYEGHLYFTEERCVLKCLFNDSTVHLLRFHPCTYDFYVNILCSDNVHLNFEEKI